MAKLVVNWNWSEAFSRSGLSGVAGLTITYLVQNYINSLGYEAECRVWGSYNEVICSVKSSEGVELLNTEGFSVGYDNPRLVLPSSLVEALNEKFGNDLVAEA